MKKGKYINRKRRFIMAKTLHNTKSGISGLKLDIATINKMGRDATEVGLGVITVLAALIGIWGIACLVGGVAHSGLGELVNGFITAVTGR